MRKMTTLLAVLAIITVACGSEDSSDGVASLESETDVLAADQDAATEVIATDVDDEEAMLAFAQCLRDQGLDVPDPEVDADGNLRLVRPNQGDGQQVDRETIEAARAACSDILEGVSFGIRDRDRTDIEDTLVEFASCMRDHGYEMPDPDFAAQPGPGGGGGPFGEIDRTDPAFIEASEACGEILATAFGDDGPPGRGPGSGGAGGGGGEG
jgi:hypothetical protein